MHHDRPHLRSRSRCAEARSRRLAPPPTRSTSALQVGVADRPERQPPPVTTQPQDDSSSVDRYELGPIGTNCYVVRAERGAAEAVVIDPGGDAAELRLELARLGARCAGDPDHAQALGSPRRRSPTSPKGPARRSTCPRSRRPCSQSPADFYPGHPASAPYERRRSLLAGDETVDLAGISFEMVQVPGHSPGHVAYYADGCLFSGDVLFAGSVGRTDLPMADWETLLESIRAARRPLPARDRRLLRPRPADDARRRARAQPVPRPSCAP